MIRPISILILALSLSANCVAKSNSGSEPGVVESAKTLGNKVWEKTKEVTGQAVDKSKSLYQSAKENGSEAGSVVADKSRSAWDSTKEVAGDTYENGKEMGGAAVTKAGEVSGAIVDKSKEIYKNVTKENSAEPAPVKSHNM
ncbi:MAG: hypothetical protein RPU59_13500 [Candidatus Sedimenticola sp. (ex Thyasira tokunagai)]